MDQRIKEHSTRLSSTLTRARAIQADYVAAVARVNERNEATGAYKFSDPERHAEGLRLRKLALDKLEDLGVHEALQQTPGLLEEYVGYWTPDAMLNRARFVPPAAGVSSTETLLTELLNKFAGLELRTEASSLPDEALAPMIRDASARGDLATLRVLGQEHARHVREQTNSMDTSVALLTAKAALQKLPEVTAAAKLHDAVDSTARQIFELRENIRSNSRELEAKVASLRDAAAAAA